MIDDIRNLGNNIWKPRRWKLMRLIEHYHKEGSEESIHTKNIEKN